MILVDTSIWIEHLQRGNRHLADLLEQGDVCVHPMLIGELACGTIPNRGVVLDLLNRLPSVTVASAGEALHFIDEHRLMGRGIGYIDVHLLAAVFLTPDARIWTADARLAAASARLFVNYDG